MTLKLLFYVCILFATLCYGCIFAQEYTRPPHDRHMVCYVATWANYRPSPASFTPDDIDPGQCTHLIYSFVGLDNETNTVVSLDPWADLDPPDGRGYFRQFTGLKVEYPHLKVLLAVGGFDEGSKKYSIMASSPETRAVFIESAVTMTRRYDFDGFDLDWEYPGRRGGAPEDKENFVLLAKELREELDRYGLLLTAAFGANVEKMDVSYDFPGLAPHLHLFNIMAYDYHGAFDNVTGANAPFYPQYDNFSVTDTLTYLVEMGAPMDKVVLGLPLYAQTFIMDEIQDEGFLELGVPCNTTGFAGVYTGAPGFMSDQEICLLLSHPNWTRFWDNDTGTPFLLNQDLLISYDDEESIALKIDYAIGLGLGGLMVWSMDTDDFQTDDNCFGHRFPMMTFINKRIMDLTTTTLDPTATTTVTTTTTDSSGDWTKPPHPLHMVCYISTWATYRTGVPKYNIEHIDPRLCTHLIYAFAGVHNKTFIANSLDPVLDLDTNEGGKANFRKMTALKAVHPHLKVLLAVGGASEKSSLYSEMASSPSKRRLFKYSLVDLLIKYGFDGLDLDWEYPCKDGGAPEDRENFVTLVKELRAELNKYGMLLTSAFGAGIDTIKLAYDIPALAPHLDMFLIMAYDYHGAWNNMTGSNAPLGRQEDHLSLMDTLDYLNELGAPMEKVVLGLPLYGHTFILLDPNDEGASVLGAPAENEGFMGTFIRQAGFMGYQEIHKNLKDAAWKYYWDANTSTPYIINKEKVVSYDDAESLTMKVDYAVRYGLGGLMVWSMDTDEFGGTISTIKYPLMKRINNAVKETLDDMGSQTTTSTTTTAETTEDPGEVTTTMATTATTEDPGWTAPPHDLNVVCYVKTWSYYRYKPANFTISDIDPTLCTHLIYMYAGLDDKTWKIKTLNTELDPNVDEKGRGYFMRMTGLRENHAHLTVLLAVGGESENSENYSTMAADPVKRATFVDSVIRMLLKYEFNGLDLNWQYPGERGGKPEDKANFVKLIQDLRTAFDRYEFILSLAIHGSPSIMATAYDFPAFRDNVQLLNVMSFDYNMPEANITGPNAPLYDMGNISYSVEETLQYLSENGAPMEKVVLGIPFYGHTFIVDEEISSNPWEIPATSSFSGAFVSSAVGFMAYNEICYDLTDKYWDNFWDTSTDTPYAVNRDKLISYDDEQSISMKVKMALDYNIGGFMAWSIDTDDFQGDCGGGRYPLLKAISKTIKSTVTTTETSTPTSTTTTRRSTSTAWPSSASTTSTSTSTSTPTTTPSRSQRITVSMLCLLLVPTLTLLYATTK